MPFIKASLGVTTAVLFRQVSFTEEGGVLFYGDVWRPDDVEIVDGIPPPRVQKYS